MVFYLDATRALDYGLIDAIVAGELPRPKPAVQELKEVGDVAASETPPLAEAARESPAIRETGQAGKRP